MARDVAQREDQTAANTAVAAEDASRTVDIARLAHELRTPLGAIVVLAEIMRDERLGPLGNERYREYAADIHQSAALANTVIAAFLDPAASGRGGSGPLEFAELDLAAVVKSGVSALAEMAAASGVEIASHTPPGLPHVIADRRSVLQMLNNLIANALKYTPPGGRLDVHLGYRPGGPVVLEVADNGDGMSEAELRRVSPGCGTAEPLRRRSGGNRHRHSPGAHSGCRGRSDTFDQKRAWTWHSRLDRVSARSRGTGVTDGAGADLA
jgi:signal transduction histidine kinase